MQNEIKHHLVQLCKYEIKSDAQPITPGMFLYAYGLGWCSGLLYKSAFDSL